MALEPIRPKDLPPSVTVYATDRIPSDDGVNVGGALPVQIVDAGAPVPSEATAIAGIDNVSRMTPFLTRAVLNNEIAPSVLLAQAWAESPTPPIPGSESSKTWAGQAEVFRDQAAISATAAALYDGPWLDTVAALIADTSLTYAPALPGTVVAGDYVQTRKEGFAYQVAASGASDHHVTTAGGVKLYYESGGMVGESGRRFQFVSGVIRNRNDGLGWQLISDGSHGHVGVSAIGTNTTGVNVAFDFTATKVISFVAGPDERMAQAGMTVGGSVGLTSSGLWIGAPLQFWFDPVTAYITAPAWFDPASFGISGSGAVRVVTHPEISSANSAPVLGSGFASTLNCPDYGVSSFTTTTFGLQSFVDLSGFVYFNGSSWVILTDVDTSVHTITAAWEAANGGQLRITHPSSDSDFEVALISSSSAHRAFVNAVTDTSFTVQFFDHATNTQVASAVSPIGVRFSRRRRCRAASLQSGRVTCFRTQARLDPTLLHDGSLPLANIWFVGLFEI